MPDINLIIDGVPVTVPAGTNVVDAARVAGIAIPVFCYHPRLQPVGMCRMCLVAVGMPKLDPQTRQPLLGEDGKPVIQMMPKLQTGCTTPVSEGMVVVTNNEQVEFAQKGVLEFLLTSHPLDCPVCDKGGECPLQNLTMGWGPAVSRFEYEEKIHFEKPVPLGDLIYLDRERCILCSRCVRFQDELADDPVLGFDNRGRSWMIISKSDPPFDSKFSGNTTDICPVGALTSSDFRFKARVWELASKPSICTHCPVGCNITLDMRHDKLMRVMPRENSAVNDIWICDKGRYGQRFFESGERLTHPLIRRGDRLETATWDEALTLVALKLGQVRDSVGGAALGGLAGPREANEDLYLFQRLFHELLGSNNLDHRPGAPGDTALDDMGALLGVGVGTDLHKLGQGTTVLLVGADPEEQAPLYMLRLRALQQRGGRLIVANARPTKLDRSASVKLRYRPGTEQLFVRALLGAIYEAVGTTKLTLRVNGAEELKAALRALPVAEAAAQAGVPEAALRDAARAFVEAENGIIVYGHEALVAGPGVAQDLGTVALLAGKTGRANNGLIALLPWGNSRGALDMGVRPDRGPGYATLAQPGLNAAQMLTAAREGRLRAMYVMGLDPAAESPAARTALNTLEFLVVQDMFLTPTAELADVVLPAASFAERDGSYTNAERRVQRARQAALPKGAALPGWVIIQRIAQALAPLVPLAEPAVMPVAAAARSQGRDKGKGKRPAAPVAVAERGAWDYLVADEIADEIAERVPGYTGITYARLSATGRGGSWGRQHNDSVYYDGTSYENSEGVGLQYPAAVEWQLGSVSLAPQPIQAPPPAGDYPLLLETRRLLYDGDPLLRGSKLLSHVPQPFACFSAADAQRLGVRPGQPVRLRSAAGTLELSARVLTNLPEGAVVVPMNLPGAQLATIQTGPRTMVAVEL